MINRRYFLKMSGILSAALFIPFSTVLGPSQNRPVELVSDGVTYRGAQAGEIQISKDGGRTWQLHTRLGSQYAILDLFSDSSQRAHAKVAFAGRTFELALAQDKKYWMTV